MTHPITRKLPAHRGCFSYSRIPMDGGAVVYRLFRRDLMRRVHAVRRNFHPDCGRACMAQELNIARHRLRDTVDDIDLEIMGLTLELSCGEAVRLDEQLDRHGVTMKTDTEYLRGVADNENLPSLMRETLRMAAAEIETLRADMARVDWLADRENKIGNVQLPTMCVMNNMHSLRAAIDEAMRLDPTIWDALGGADAGESFNAD